MRLLFFFVLLLAGCASSEGPASNIPSRMGEQERSKGMIGQFRKCFEENKDPVCAYKAGAAAEKSGDLNGAKHWYTLAARYGQPDAIASLARLGAPVPPTDLLPQPQQMEKSELQMVQGWMDVSGKGRGDSMLYRDSATCQTSYRQALDEARKLYPESQPEEDCPDCGTRNAKAVILRQQNVRNFADAAYGECMAAKGWRKK